MRLYPAVFAITVLMVPLMVQNGALADTSSFTTPPLVQFRAGTPPSDTICLESLTLVIKSENNHPACVTQNTAQRLAQLDWGQISAKQTKPSAENPSDANNNFAFSLLG
ncbi:MAG: hypothetical protein ACREBJ_09375, partial [Nitrosotalea sp.]